MGSTAGNLIGQRFGRLLVLRKAESIQRNTRSGCYAMWLCRCDCGTEKTVRGSHLRGEKIKSCGCYSIDQAAVRTRTHGMTKSPTYRTWAAIKRRCHNPSQLGYQQYGARGVTVCSRWRESFEAFLADMGEKPDGLTIDRIDSSKGYEPDNCRWATPKEQSYNKINNIGVRPIGPYRSIIEAAEAIGINYGTLHSRLKRGMSVEDALNRPLRQQGCVSNT